MLKTVGNPSTRYGDQTIIGGNLVIGTSGKGVDFSDTPGTGTSELFDDYEEGYWSPTFTCGTSGSVTLDAAEDKLSYTKIGRVVYLHGQVAFSSVSSPTGTMTVGNLPYPLAALDERSETGVINIALGNTTLNTPTFFGIANIAGASTFVVRAKNNVGAPNNSTASLFDANDLFLSGFYLTD